jgi:hypothetical protein
MANLSIEDVMASLVAGLARAVEGEVLKNCHAEIPYQCHWQVPALRRRIDLR